MEVIWHKSIGSTNEEGKALVKEGAKHGTLIGANFQEAGKGRGGNRWQCKPGEGLMCSIILQPKWEKEFWGWIALAAGLALCELLERDCLTPKIKWPNDILVNGKKIAGILTESIDNSVIVGIGMNLNMAMVPVVSSTLQPTSFFLETDCKLNPESYAKSVQTHLTQLVGAESPLLLKPAILKRLAWLGEAVTLQTRSEEMEGEITNLGKHGELILNQMGQDKQVFDAYQLRPQ